MFWTARTAKRSGSMARNGFGEDWNWDIDDIDLIPHHSLLLYVGTSGIIAFYQPNLHMNNGVHSLAQFESIKDVFDRDGVMAIIMANNDQDVNATTKMRRKRLPTGSALIHMHNVWEMVGIIKIEL
jgi:hypothetical protein